MSHSIHENSIESSKFAGVVAATQAFLAGRDQDAELDAAIAEGRAIAAIVEPFGLSDRLLAAVYAYPAVREGMLSIKTIENSELRDPDSLSHMNNSPA